MKSKSAAMQMFYGERGCDEIIDNSREYQKHMDKVVEYHDALREKLANSPEMLELLENFCENLDAAHAEEADSFYERGFNFGLVLGVEAGKS